MPAARGLIGLQEPIPADRLQSLYGSKAEYLERFDAEIDELVAQRWLLPEAGERLKSEEAERPAFQDHATIGTTAFEAGLVNGIGRRAAGAIRLR